MAKKPTKMMAYVLTMLMLFSMFSLHSLAAEPNVAKIGETEYATLADAVKAAEKGAVIELIDEVTFDAAMTISNNVTIKGGTITRADGYTGTLFTVNAGAELVLDGVIIDGGNGWDFDYATFKQDVALGKSVTPANTTYHTLEEGAPILTKSAFVVNGNLVLAGDTVVKNHSMINSDSVCIFYVTNGGYLQTDAAQITHNHKLGRMVVANVLAGGKWVINKGTVMDDNYCQGGNGGLVRTNGTVIINDGLFTNNYSIGNGSIFMNYMETSYLELNDGLFTENYCLNNGNDNWNGVIHCHYQGGTTFVMNGGTITNNYGSYCGGLSAPKGGTPATIIVKGGVIENNGATQIGKDVSLGQNITIDGNVPMEEVKAYKDVTVTDGNTLSVETLYFNGWLGAKNFNGPGVVDGDIYLYNNADVYMNSGSWLNGMVTVNAKGNTSTLIVKEGATIDGIQVRVLDSVASGDYLNAEEAAAAQAASYVNEGGNVISPVLFYHRLIPAQMSKIVVTFDYNGGLDAQNWSGCQLTSAESFIPVSPAPMKEGYIFAGWKYAVDNAAETLDMSGTEWYQGEVIEKSLRLVAQWKKEMPEEVTFEAGTASHICYLFVNKETGDVIYDSKIDFDDGDTSAAIPAKDGYISVVFIKQAKSGMIWTSEEVEEVTMDAIVAAIMKGDKAYKGHDAEVSGKGDHTLTYSIGNAKKGKTQSVTYTFE